MSGNDSHTKIHWTQKSKDWVMMQADRKPSRLFPQTMWDGVARSCRSFNYRSDQLRRIYLDWCTFHGYHRGGVVVDKFFVETCRLDMLGLDDLCLRLFPSLETVEVVECLYSSVDKTRGERTTKNGGGGRNQQQVSSSSPKGGKPSSPKASGGVNISTLKSIKVRPSMAPSEPFLVSDGFSDRELSGETVFAKGDLIVIEHFGLKDDQRTKVSFLGSASDPGLFARAKEDKAYQVALERTRERAQDSIEEAKEKVERDVYSISFCKFARALLLFCSLSFEELARFAASELLRNNDVRAMVRCMHAKCSSAEEKRLIEKLFDTRYSLEGKGSTERDRIITFMERYPVIFSPLVLIQRSFRRHACGFPKGMGGNKITYPVKFRQAWTYTGRELIRRVLREVDPNARARSPSVSGDDDTSERTSSGKQFLNSLKTIQSFGGMKNGLKSLKIRRKSSLFGDKQPQAPAPKYQMGGFAAPPTSNQDAEAPSEDVLQNNPVVDAAACGGVNERPGFKSKFIAKHDPAGALAAPELAPSSEPETAQGAVQNNAAQLPGTTRGLSTEAMASMDRKNSSFRRRKRGSLNENSGPSGSVSAAGLDMSQRVGGGRRRSSTISLFTAKSMEASKKLSMIFQPSKGDLQGVLGGYSSRKIKRATRCPGCRQNTFVEATTFCIQCERKAFALLADSGGYQFAHGMIGKAKDPSPQGLPAPIPDVWLEQYDKKQKKTFFFNVATGQSIWELPPGTLKDLQKKKKQQQQKKKKKKGAKVKDSGGTEGDPEMDDLGERANEVRHFTPEQLARAKLKKVPEWRSAPTSSVPRKPAATP